MSSLLTNTSAMVALQTLRSINKNLAQTQSEISTGKSIGNARDNAAVWSIAKTMESDVRGFKAIGDSLALGSSTVAVARQAAETVTSLLTDMKGLIVAAQEENVDRSKIQTDIAALRDQIDSVVNAAQFNGRNAVNGSDASAINILASLDRSEGGSVASGQISISLSDTNLSRNAGTNILPAGIPGTGAVTPIANGATVTLDGNQFLFVNAAGAATNDGTFARDINSLTAPPNSPPGAMVAGDRVQLDLNGTRVAYTIREGDAKTSIVSGLRDALQAAGLPSSIGINVTANGLGFEITNNTGEEISYQLTATRGQGGLSDLNTLTIAGTDTQRTDALRNIETMIQYSIDAASTFGSGQKRIDIQAEFIRNLSDALTTGIGSLVDADMEETSARLQALQVQQQLAIQSLSIANQQPQNILALFR